MQRRTAILICLTILVSVVVPVGGGVYLAYKTGTQAGVAVGLVITAISSFLGFLMLAQSGDTRWRLTEASMRLGITGSIVVVYLVLVSLVALLQQGAEKLPPISQTLITSFTTIVGIVIAFYFGSSAYIEASRRGQANAETSEPEEKSSGGTPAV
jgi:Kef-type K+ transport system membrane component KefB